MAAYTDCTTARTCTIAFCSHARFRRQHQTLAHVDVSSNSIGAVGASTLAASLPLSASLTSFGIGHNDIGDGTHAARWVCCARRKALCGLGGKTTGGLRKDGRTGRQMKRGLVDRRQPD
eukprot:2043226-Pleurochrysis_carterae.AAC.2